MFWAGLIVGVLIGGTGGLIATALLVASKRSESDENN